MYIRINIAVIALMISERDMVSCITWTTMEVPSNPEWLYRRHRVVFMLVLVSVKKAVLIYAVPFKSARQHTAKIQL